MTNEHEQLYADIAQRTGGNIYIGVTGPVRAGKSTFVKRVMETLVLPQIADIYLRERAKDELPQCGSGRTIMTAEPKFVPEEAVEIIRAYGVDRAIYGTDYPMWEPGEELERFFSLKLGDEMNEMILGKNFENFLNAKGLF